jgi:hypothetical protein
MRGSRFTMCHWADDPAVRACIGVDVADWLAERNSWPALVYGTACLAAAVYLSVHHIWPMALIWAVWSMVAFRRWLRTQPWAGKFTRRP